ncbi:MAG: methyltransferase domain-containing protein [Pseudomonadota bacterium]
MSETDRKKWDQRYAEDSYRKGNPVALLKEWLPQPATGRALDVACGAGRNSVLLAQCGYQVDAIDISTEGLAKAEQTAASHGLQINWIEHDFDEPYEFETQYDLIVVLWYVNLPLIRTLCDWLRPGGYLICEEHLDTEQTVDGPANSSFRVAPGALRSSVVGVDILLDEETVELQSDGKNIASARLVVRKPGSR